MKKIVRLSENDLNRLVKRIISEAPFDSDRVEDPINFDNLSDNEFQDKINTHKKNVSDYQEFEKSDLRKLLADTEILLAIAKDYCKNYLYDDQPHQYCGEITFIEKRINKYHSDKFSKRGSGFPEQPILPQLVARRK